MDRTANAHRKMAVIIRNHEAGIGNVTVRFLKIAELWYVFIRDDSRSVNPLRQ